MILAGMALGILFVGIVSGNVVLVGLSIILVILSVL